MFIINKIIKKIADRRPINLETKLVEPDRLLANRTAVIIGGGTGIGHAIAKNLKEAGCRVIICGRKKYNIEDYESEVWDVSDIKKIHSNIAKITEKYGMIDIVVNSQGLCPKVDFAQSFSEVNQEDFESVFKVNIESVFFICQEFCEYFEKNHIQGHILNICSTEGLKGSVVPYGLSKGAVVNLTKGLGKKMAGKGIVVNGIAPGATATSMIGMDETRDLRKNYIPSKRASIPNEIAKAALFLIADSGKQMCGEVLVMDGGESLH